MTAGAHTTRIHHRTIVAGGRTLACDVHEPGVAVARPRVIALVLHGWTGSRGGSSRTLGSALASVGIPTLVPDLPGHGESAGDREALTRAQFLSAAAACLDLLGAELDAPRDAPVLLAGISFGGYLAAQLAARGGVDALALRVPADYPDDGFDDATMGELLGGAAQQRIVAWRRSGGASTDTRARRALAALNVPVLVQQAELDQDVPAAQLDAWWQALAATPAPRRALLAGAPHALGTSPAHLAVANAQLVEWALGATA